MLHVVHEPLDASAPDVAWPRTVVCGVDGTAASREAVRQAIELSGAHRKLEIVAVTAAAGQPPFAPLRDVAAMALANAQRIAHGHEVAATAQAVNAASAAEGLIRAANGADLLVLGCDALGRVPMAVLRRAPSSLLLARKPPDLPLLDTILVAAGGAPQTHLAAAAIANEHGSELHTVSPATLATAAAAMGAGLIVITHDGDAAQIARAAPCSVLIMRDRG